jgi:hypothetical protein
MDILGQRSQTLASWLAFILAASWVVYELRKDDQLPTGATMSSKLLPSLLIATLFVTAAMHVIAAVISRRQPKAPEDKVEGIDPAKHKETVDKLNECESLRRLEADEVKRVAQDYQEQLRLARDQCTKSDTRVSELEQQLRVSQGMIDNLRNQFSAPNGRFKLKKVRYVATGSRSLELQDAGKLPERDLTEFFEDKYLENGKLVIPPGLYRKMFGAINDPSIGVPKVLEINFVHAGHEMSLLLPENISTTLPFPYSVTEEDMS